MNTIENNKLIADFMGYEGGFPHKTDKYGHQCEEGFHIPDIINHDRHDEDRTSHEFLIEQLMFDKSWDWLMSVVEKIEGLTTVDKEGLENYPNIEQCWRIEIFNDWCRIKYASHLYGWSDHIETKEASKIEATYKAVIEFIKWYNLNKQP